MSRSMGAWPGRFLQGDSARIPAGHDSPGAVLLPQGATIPKALIAAG